MFDYTLLHWLTFFTAAILLTLSPGPDIAFILTQTIKNGKQAGFSAMYGIWTGAFFHVFLAALGLSAILATSAAAFTIVKVIGASYLIYIGIQSLYSSGGFNITEQKNAREGNVFRQGMIVAALNPKTAIFFLSFLPQFVVVGSGPVSAQLFLHGTLVIAVAVFIEPPLILAGTRLTEKLETSPYINLWLDRFLGSVFIGLGIRLAIQKQA